MLRALGSKCTVYWFSTIRSFILRVSALFTKRSDTNASPLPTVEYGRDKLILPIGMQTSDSNGSSVTS